MNIAIFEYFNILSVSPQYFHISIFKSLHSKKMGNPKAFLTIHRKEAGYRPIHDRIHDFGEVEQTLNSNDRRLQASRCMDCGVPFCHWACPLGNKAP